VLLKTEIGLKPTIWEIELFLFTMLNTKKFPNQPTDSEPITWIPILLMSINKSIKNGTHSKVTGIISTSVIVMLKKLLLVT